MDPHAPLAWSSFAVRSRSPRARDLVAERARRGSPPWQRAYARMLSLEHPGTTQRWEQAVDTFAEAGDPATWPAADRELFAQVLSRLGRHREAAAVASTGVISAPALWALRADAARPDAQPWADVVAEPFSATGLTAPVPTAAGFPALAADSPAVRHGPLVTVGITCFQPDDNLAMVVRSITRQSWQDLEIMVLDDASGPAYDDLLADVAASDERVRVIRMPVNGGAYVARNRALAEARGGFITFQDSDDWAHPERIARQLAPLSRDDEAWGTRSWCLRATSDLVFTAPGLPVARANQSSLLVRTDAARAAGGWDPIRKSADVEFPARIRRRTGTDAVEVPDAGPLALVQLRDASLSRSDIGPGYLAPARISYRAAFERWHATTQMPTLGDSRAFPLPTPAWRPERTDEPDSVDTVVVAHLTSQDQMAEAVAARIRALAAKGTVAVAHVESPVPAPRWQRAREPRIQDLFNSGLVTPAHPDQPLRARAAVFFGADIALWGPDEPWPWDVERAVIVGAEVPDDATAAVRAALGVTPEVEAGPRLSPVGRWFDWSSAKTRVGAEVFGRAPWLTRVLPAGLRGKVERYIFLTSSDGALAGPGWFGLDGAAPAQHDVDGAPQDS